MCVTTINTTIPPRPRASQRNHTRVWRGPPKNCGNADKYKGFGRFRQNLITCENVGFCGYFCKMFPQCFPILFPHILTNDNKHDKYSNNIQP